MKIENISKLVLVSLLAITAFFCYSAITKLEISNDFERFFPLENNDVEFYNKYKNEFLSENEQAIIAIKLPSGVYNLNTLKKLNRLSDSLKSVANIKSVISLTELEYPVKSGFGGYASMPYVSLTNQSQLKKDSIHIAKNTALVGTAIAHDYSGVTVSLMTPYDLTNSEIQDLQISIETNLKRFGFNDYYLGGRLLGQIHIIDTLKYEMLFFTGLAAILIIVTMSMLYRSFWAIASSILVVAVSVVWTLGVIALIGKPIDVLSSIIPAILCAIGISDIIHLYQNYLDSLQNGMNKLSALRNTYKEVGYTTLLTSLTTMIGFLSLLTSSLQPLREFGIYTAIGVLFAFILTYSLFPAILILSKTPTNKGFKPSKVATTYLAQLHLFVFRNSKLIYLGFGLLVLTGIWSISQLQINNYLVEELSKKDRYRQGYIYLDESFSGMRPFEIAVKPSDSSNTLLDFAVVAEINALETFVKKLYNTNASAGLNNVASLLYKAELNAASDFVFPKDTLAYNRIKPMMRRAIATSKSSFILSNDKKTTRITGLSKDLGGKNNILLNKKIEEFARLNCTNLDVRITGMPYLIDENNRNIVKEMLLGLSFAFVIVSFIIGFIYRSIKIVLIALIPNVLPLIMICIFMYILHFELNVSTALIFAIAFGIAVDDTIHFLSKLKIELNRGLNVYEAIKQTYLSTGKAIIMTSMILFAGFITLAFSEFTSSYYFGVLVSTTILFAVLSDLLILPLLLSKTVKQKN